MAVFSTSDWTAYDRWMQVCLTHKNGSKSLGNVQGGERNIEIKFNRVVWDLLAVSKSPTMIRYIALLSENWLQFECGEDHIAAMIMRHTESI